MIDTGDDDSGLIIVWQDPNLDSPEKKEKQERLRNNKILCKGLVPFTNALSALQYVSENYNSIDTFMISDVNGEDIIAHIIHGFENISFRNFIIYCENVEENLNWTQYYGLSRNVLNDWVEVEKTLKSFAGFPPSYVFVPKDKTVMTDQPNEGALIGKKVESFVPSKKKHKSNDKFNGDFDDLLPFDSNVGTIRMKFKLSPFLINSKQEETMINNSQDQVGFETVLKYYNKNMIRLYTEETFFYKSLNNALRESKMNEFAKYANSAKKLNDEIRKLILSNKYRGTVYRVGQFSEKQFELFGQAKNQEDPKIIFPAFTSTTMNYNTAISWNLDSNTFMEIFIPSSVPESNLPVKIEEISKYPNEHEVLFQMGSCFEIIEMKILLEDQKKGKNNFYLKLRFDGTVL